MKKTFILFLAIALTTLQVQAASPSGLKAAFDEFNYGLNVEWDQKDQAFYQERLEAFQDSINTLKKAGLSNADVLNFIGSETKNESLKRELSLIHTQVAVNLLSEAQALKLIRGALERSTSKGASWDAGDDRLTWIGPGVLLLGAVFILICASGEDSEVQISTGTTCSSDDGCYDTAQVTCRP